MVLLQVLDQSSDSHVLTGCYVLVLIEYVQSINRAHLRDCRRPKIAGALMMTVVISARSFMWATVVMKHRPHTHELI